MNNSEVAKNGFKTFIITLTVSLVLFSIVYYFVTGSSKDIDIEQQDLQVAKSSAVAGVTTSTPTEVTGPIAADTSVFYDLATTKMNEPAKAVLAGATESTTSVPSTGSTEITWGFLLSVLALGFGSYLIFLGPRKAAIQHFETKVFKDLD